MLVCNRWPLLDGIIGSKCSTNMKRRSRITSKSYSTSYFDVSPSKKRPLRRRIVSSDVNDSPSASACSSDLHGTIAIGTTDTRLDQFSRSTSPDLVLPSDENLTFCTFSEDPAVHGPSYSE